MLDHRLAALMYGGSLGLGVLTHVRFATFHVVLAWILLYGTPTSGLVLMACYGAARALAIIATGWPVAHAEQAGEAVIRLRRYLLEHAPALVQINGWGLVVVLVYGVGAVIKKTMLG